MPYIITALVSSTASVPGYLKKKLIFAVSVVYEDIMVSFLAGIKIFSTPELINRP
jgi:hypothetical protein